MKRKISLLFLTAMFTLLFSAVVMAAPAKVTGVKQTSADTTSVTVSWGAVLGNNVYYEVSMSNDGSNWNVVSDSYQSSTSYTKYSLTSGTTYYLRVRAKESDVEGAYSDTIQVTTLPDEITDLKQTAATTSSITVSWGKVAGATSYKVCKWVNGTESVIGITTGNTYTITGLNNKVDVAYEIYVKPLRTVGSFTAEQKVNYSWDVDTLDKYDIKLVPQKISAINITSYWTYLESCRFEITTVKFADGHQYEIYNAKTNKKVSSGTMTSGGFGNYYKDPSGIKRNNFYKVRVRAYNTVNNKTYYGAWSDYEYFANGTKSTVKKVKKKKLKIKWNKVKGATGYTVYVSTSKDAGYKKVKTVSSKKNSISLSKIKKKKIKKKKTYYVYVVANKKVGKTTYKSGGNDVTSTQ